MSQPIEVKTICDGKIIMVNTPDDRDIWICQKCGKQYRFDFNIQRICNNKIISKNEPNHNK